MDDLQRVRERLIAYLEDAKGSRGGDADDYRATFASRKIEELEERKDSLRKYEAAGLRLISAPRYPDIVPTLTRAKTQEDKRIWRYFRNILSRGPYAGRVGRVLMFFLIDSNSGGLLGILELQSSIRFMKLRDDYIGWSSQDKYREGKLNNMIDGGTIVSTRPFGLLCGGKGLTLAAISNEVREEFTRAYGDPVVAFMTTSLYGKSSQYNRVRDLEYLGETEGGGVTHLPGEFYGLGRKYLAAIGDGTVLTWANAGRLNVLQHLAGSLGIRLEDISSKQKRGVYYATYATNAEEFLRSEIPESKIDFIDRPLDAQISYFMERWLLMRWPKKRDEVEGFDPEEYRISNIIESNRKHLYGHQERVDAGNADRNSESTDRKDKP